MKKAMKKLLSIVLAVAMVICCLSVQPVEAKTVLSAKQIQSKIASTKKSIKKLEKQYNAAVKKEKKQAKGSISIVGDIVSRNPYVVRTSFFGDSYYWVLNPKNMNDLLVSAVGYVVPTGKYRNYNGITCTECKAVKVSNKSRGIKRKINNKKNELKKYQNALKEKVYLRDSEADMEVGATWKLPWNWMHGGSYNKITWKSSNKSVATVDKNGKVTAKKEGKAVITATCSASKKKSKCTINVYEPVKNITIEQATEIYQNAEDSIGKISVVYFDLQGISLNDITVTSSNEEVAVVTQVDFDCFYYEGTGAGTTTFTVTDGEHSASVILTIAPESTDNENNDVYNDSEYYDDYSSYYE